MKTWRTISSVSLTIARQCFYVQRLWRRRRSKRHCTEIPAIKWHLKYREITLWAAELPSSQYKPKIYMAETHEFTGFAWSVQMLNISPALKRTKHSSKLKLKNHSMTKVSHFNLNIFWALVKAQQSLLHNPPLTSLRGWEGGNFHMKRTGVLPYTF